MLAMVPTQPSPTLWYIVPLPGLGTGECPVQDLLLDLERLVLSGDRRALATLLTKRFVLIPSGVELAADDAPEARKASGWTAGGRGVGGRSGLTSGPLYGTPRWAVTGTFKESKDPSMSR